MTALKNKNKKPYPPKKTITKKQRKALILSALHCNIQNRVYARPIFCGI
jgi:hypothetical protein